MTSSHSKVLVPDDGDHDPGGDCTVCAPRLDLSQVWAGVVSIVVSIGRGVLRGGPCWVVRGGVEVVCSRVVECALRCVTSVAVYPSRRGCFRVAAAASLTAATTTLPAASHRTDSVAFAC